MIEVRAHRQDQPRPGVSGGALQRFEKDCDLSLGRADEELLELIEDDEPPNPALLARR